MRKDKPSFYSSCEKNDERICVSTVAYHRTTIGSREKVGHGIGALRQKWGYRPPENWKRKEVVTYWRLLLHKHFLVIVLMLTLRQDLEVNKCYNVVSDGDSDQVEMRIYYVNGK